MTPDISLIDARSVLTVVSLVTFLAIVWFTYSKKRKTSFDEAANLPFADEDIASVSSKIKSVEKQHG